MEPLLVVNTAHKWTDRDMMERDQPGLSVSTEVGYILIKIFRLDTFIYPDLDIILYGNCPLSLMPSRVKVEHNTIDNYSNYIFIYMLVVVIVDVLWRRKDIGGGDVPSDEPKESVYSVC